jgi:hypothetical protein
MYNKVSEMFILATEYRQRAFDGKWEKLIKISDLDNSYSYTNENGNRAVQVPDKWLCVDVQDKPPTEKDV